MHAYVANMYEKLRRTQSNYWTKELSIRKKGQETKLQRTEEETT